jgi:hypothetical protein
MLPKKSFVFCHQLNMAGFEPIKAVPKIHTQIIRRRTPGYSYNPG